ncbi:MAG: hypothetical protein U0R19_35610 [Bryobacteraceae bacterium]
MTIQLSRPPRVAWSLSNPAQDQEAFVFRDPLAIDNDLRLQVPWASWALRDGEAILIASADFDRGPQCESVAGIHQSRLQLFANRLEQELLGDPLQVQAAWKRAAGRLDILFESGRSLGIFPARSKNQQSISELEAPA